MSRLFKGLERIEEARERFMAPSFMAGLYDGRPDFDLLLAPPEPPEERAAGADYLARAREKLQGAGVPAEKQAAAAWESYVRAILMSNEFVYVN